MSWEQFWFVLIGCVLAMWACRVIPLFLLKGRELPPPPASTMCGALLDYITTPNKDFQPMGANMGILPRTEEINTIRDKRERYAALSQNAQNAMHAWVEEYK